MTAMRATKEFLANALIGLEGGAFIEDKKNNQLLTQFDRIEFVNGDKEVSLNLFWKGEKTFTLTERFGFSADGSVRTVIFTGFTGTMEVRIG